MKNRIKELRARYNLTQEDLALKVNVVRHTIMAIEKSKYNPSLELAFKFSILFDCPIEHIFYYEQNPKDGVILPLINKENSWCLNCGSILPKNANYCDKCGEKLN